MDILLYCSAAFSAAGVALVVVLLLRIRRFGADGGDAALRRLEQRSAEDAALLRREMSDGLSRISESSMSAMSAIFSSTRKELDAMRTSIDGQLRQLQKENAASLSSLRRTVDQGLRQSVSQGLDDSFRAVSAQLDRVYKSLGEMHSLTADVSSLRDVLANVKNRGTWGEVQLESIISDMLTSSQYARQFPLGAGRVDFAVRLPSSGGEAVYLPIDSKFPLDKYRAVAMAESSGDVAALASARAALFRALELQAADIASKYIVPGKTTDYAVLFVPSEGLYALLASGDTAFALQEKHRVIVAGPSTISALLSSFRMGFQSMALEQRSGEILSLLGAVKKGFGAFSANLASVKRSINAAANHLDRAESSSRAIERQLDGVSQLPGSEPAPPEFSPDLDFPIYTYDESPPQ